MSHDQVVPAGWGARRLASTAVALGAVAVLAVFVAVAGAPRVDDGDDSGWVLGLLVLGAPMAAAATTRWVAGSGLLRPIGAGAAVVAALGSALHVAIAVDFRGGWGWALGAPALAATALVVAAVVQGPDAPIRSAVAPRPSPAHDVPADEVPVDGPPLDVLGPLRTARAHAARSVLAWLLVLVVSLLVVPTALRALGWPTVESTVEGEVVDVLRIGDEVLATYDATDEGTRLRWRDRSQDADLRVGDRRTVHLDDDGRVHADRQLGLAGVPLLLPVALVGAFGAAALRRLWGLALAVHDASSHADAPRLGYVALVLPPRQWRPLAAVWWDDPTRGDRLARPDVVYRADDETGFELESSTEAVEVHRSWVDTGSWSGATPRWIGAERGVVVPHRRAVLGRWLFRGLTRRAAVGRVVRLRRGAPAAATLDAEVGTTHAFAPMVAWRLLAIPVSVALLLVLGPGGDVVLRLG